MPKFILFIFKTTNHIRTKPLKKLTQVFTKSFQCLRFFKKEIRNKRFDKIKKSVLIQQICKQFTASQLNKTLPIIKIDDAQTETILKTFFNYFYSSIYQL